MKKEKIIIRKASLADSSRNGLALVNGSGISLIELLISLAVMSLLSAAIIVGLNSSKMQARDNAVLVEVAKTVDKVLDCMDAGQSASVGAVVCASTGAAWPALGYGWAWGIRTGSPSTKIYDINATNGVKSIRCTNNTLIVGVTADGRCTTVGF